MEIKKNQKYISTKCSLRQLGEQFALVKVCSIEHTGGCEWQSDLQS